MVDRKEAAVHFLKLVVAGQIDEAYEEYVDLQGQHHNPFFPSGFEALRKAMAENHIEFPRKQIRAKHVLRDGNFVAVHSHLVMVPGGKEVATVHLFRFQGDRIVEMWDIGLPLPADSPNRDGAF
jgi:predicted SnoaL-like aldol condensation-catalyzing enzyme